MRVITGTARGRRLKEPADYSIRPTTDQVKEAMFNIAQFQLEGRRVLDLFGGTGQLGIEAASRGAASVTIVDASRTSLALIRENVQRTGLTGIRVVQSDAISFLARPEVFDLVLIDPPYDSTLAEDALLALKKFDILSVGGIIIVETRREKQLPSLEPPYAAGREYRYGKVKLTVYTKEG